MAIAGPKNISPSVLLRAATNLDGWLSNPSNQGDDAAVSLT